MNAQPLLTPTGAQGKGLTVAGHRLSLLLDVNPSPRPHTFQIVDGLFQLGYRSLRKLRAGLCLEGT